MSWEKNNIISDIVRVANFLDKKGWAEGFAGNISLWLTEEQKEQMDIKSVNSPWELLPSPVPKMAGQVIIVSASGASMGSLGDSVQKKLGIIELDGDGLSYRILAGFENGSRPTSELITHVKVLAVRGGKQRVVIHTHATNLITMGLSVDLNSESFSKLLWGVNAESMYFFPDGIGICPWAIPGSVTLGDSTAELIKNHRIILWPAHGIIATGEDLNKTIGLIDVADKAAGIYCNLVSMKSRKNLLSDEQLNILANTFNVTPQYPL